MAFFKTGTAQAQAQEMEPAKLEDFTRQASETCQSCGHRMSPDETGSLVCRHQGCPKAVSA